MLVALELCSTLLLLLLPAGEGIDCSQCNGWHGYYPDAEKVSTCDNLNNACSTSQFCVKIIDPIEESKGYTTFKSDCWYQTQLQVSPQNLTNVENNKCYRYVDTQIPPKQWLYCFCNDRDHCNSANKENAAMALVISLFVLCNTL